MKWVLILVCMLLVGCNSYNTEIKFDEEIWNTVYERLFYPEEKYGMALWLIEKGQLTGMESDDLCEKLFQGNKAALETATSDDVISIPLRNRKEHFGPFSYYDEHVMIIDAYMKIYMEGNIVKKAEVLKIKDGSVIVVRSTDS